MTLSRKTKVGIGAMVAAVVLIAGIGIAIYNYNESKAAAAEQARQQSLITQSILLQQQQRRAYCQQHPDECGDSSQQSSSSSSSQQQQQPSSNNNSQSQPSTPQRAQHTLYDGKYISLGADSRTTRLFTLPQAASVKYRLTSGNNNDKVYACIIRGDQDDEWRNGETTSKWACHTITSFPYTTSAVDLPAGSYRLALHCNNYYIDCSLYLSMWATY